MPNPPGTLRALQTILGRHYGICRPLRRYTDMDIPKGMEDRHTIPAPFVAANAAGAASWKPACPTASVE